MSGPSRNKLGEKFIADAYAHWQKNGMAALERMFREDPSGYVRVIAGILPDKLEVDVKHAITRIERVIVDHRPRVLEHVPADPVLTEASAPKLLSNDSNGLDK
jgi:hypothetical protein